MDKYWQALVQLTEELTARLDEVSYEEMEAYMTKRNQLFSYLQRQRLSPELREQCRPYAERVLALAPVIERRMYALKEQVAEQLMKVTSGKRQQQAYYPEQERESVFFDKKR